jgi:hypothetical protein
MKIKYYYLGITFCCAAFLLFSAFTSTPVKMSSAPAKVETSKKIKFSHKLHKDAVDCVTCHSGISESGALTEKLFPKKEDCATCHDVKDEKNCNTCHYENVQVPLQDKATPSIVFSHKSHIAGKTECKTCHAGIEETENLTADQHFAPKMETCYTCHDGRGKATNQCESCHTTLVNLKPKNHLVNNFLRFHKFQAVAPSAKCVMCHTQSSCDDCHAVTNVMTEKNTKTDFYAPYTPSQSTAGASMQKITRVHDLGFRYTHGISARGKEAECGSCHQTQTFCTECHGGKHEDYAMAGVMPSSHRKSTFTTALVGSGGGDHAVLARRDIEACAACHDVNGADPTCIRCHFDSDGIKGTNPKTHKTGFKHDQDEGDWHTNSSSVCYNCHTDANAHPGGIPGTGFCGYCHGKR